MFPALAAIILIGALVFGTMALGLTINLLYYLVAGLVIGALGRMIVPGEQRMGLLVTSLYGVAGAMLGGVLGGRFIGGGLGHLIVSALCSAALIYVFGKNKR